MYLSYIHAFQNWYRICNPEVLGGTNESIAEKLHERRERKSAMSYRERRNYMDSDRLVDLILH